MPEIGQTISHYKILSKIGQGGMGVVYRAEDTNLNRQVAIKVLPDMFSSDPERMARFEREAKLLASLNHPNIAAIYGLETAEGKRFLVLELVEGETLSQRIAKGPLPVDEAVEVCRQIADGVEAAHEKGIIHRDLKPANVKITPESKVKVLDFGLAKAFHDEPSASDQSHSPTLTDQMTRPGVILGTAAYMSPEQAKGKIADKRADIWAFGCILYECLVGKKAFEGETITETVAAILKSEPDWDALPAPTPRKLRELLHRCLRKNPHERLHDMGDARIEIGEVTEQAESRPETVPSTIVATTPAWRSILHWIIIAIVGVLAVWGWMRSSPPAATGTMRVSIDLPETQRLTGGVQEEETLGLSRPSKRAFALSPGGDNLVYSATSGNSTQLYLRPLAQPEARPMPGTQGGVMPFFSPDGKWVGFFADGKLKKAALSGGPPAVLCDAFPSGASVGSDGTIVFTNPKSFELWKMPDNGGSPEVLTTLQPGEPFHFLPDLLPNGKAILYSVGNRNSIWTADFKIVVQSFETGERRALIDDGADPQYVPTGHLVFARKGALMAAPFDPDRLEVRGAPVPILENIMQAHYGTNAGLNLASAQYSISRSGSLAFVPGGVYPDKERTLVWVDFKGAAQPLNIRKGTYYAPRLSPDGRQIAYRTHGREHDAWVCNIERGDFTKLTFEGITSEVIWNPDGKSVTFNWSKVGWTNAGPPGIYSKLADGRAEAKRLTTNEQDQRPLSWTPDGKDLAFLQQNDIWVFHTEDRRVERLTDTAFAETHPVFSPDGRWLAYASNESGRTEVYVQPYPGPGTRNIVSTEGGSEPIWAPNGRQLYYRNVWKMMAVDIKTDPAFVAGKPRMLFEHRYLRGAQANNYDIHPDGERFLMNQETDQPPQDVRQIHLVVNWLEELKRLVPTGKK